jgi:hypothetical protein
MKVLKRYLPILILSLSLVLLFWSSAITGTLTGTVVDDFYFNPVPDVEVTVFHSDSTLAGIDSTLHQRELRRYDNFGHHHNARGNDHRRPDI